MQDFGENKPHKSDLLEGSEEESGVVAAAAATAADRELSFYLSIFLSFFLSLSLSLFLSLSFFLLVHVGVGIVTKSAFYFVFFQRSVLYFVNMTILGGGGGVYGFPLF
jgi:hypothetical protein